MFKHFTNLEFGNYISLYYLNQNDKCIHISTNMPDIGLEMCDILRICETKRFSIDGETHYSRVQSTKGHTILWCPKFIIPSIYSYVPSTAAAKEVPMFQYPMLGE